MKNQSVLLGILTILVAFMSCKKTDEVTPSPIIGQWSVSGVSAINDTKTISATAEEIQNSPSVLVFVPGYYKFYTDGTCQIGDFNDYKVPQNAGKYIVSSDNKTISITPNVKDSKGNIVTNIYEILSLSNSTLSILLPKLTQKDKNGDFISNNDFENYSNFLAKIAIVSKGNINTDYSNSKSIQAVIILKK